VSNQQQVERSRLVYAPFRQVRSSEVDPVDFELHISVNFGPAEFDVDEFETKNYVKSTAGFRRA